MPPSTQFLLRIVLMPFVSDSPQRALILGCKHPNNVSKHPCTLRMVEHGGDLRDPCFDTDRMRRTKEDREEALLELEKMKESKATEEQINERRKELGVCVPDDEGPVARPLYDLVSLSNPNLHVPPDRLHADALGRYFWGSPKKIDRSLCKMHFFAIPK